MLLLSGKGKMIWFALIVEPSLQELEMMTGRLSMKWNFGVEMRSDSVDCKGLLLGRAFSLPS